MNIQRGLQYSATLQAAVGFVALTGTGKLPAALILIGCLTLVACLVRFVGYGAGSIVFRLSPIIWNVIMVTAFIASGADLAWGTQDLLQASMYVLILLMVHKLWTAQRHGDFMHLYVISFLEFLSAAVLTIELWYAIVFVLYLLTAIWALLLWHLTREAEEVTTSQGTEQALARVPLSARFFWTTNAIAMGALSLTLAIFFTMPRTGFGFFQKTGGTLIRTTGFSEQVDLGGIGAVKQDQSLVMRVQFPDMEGPPSEDLYFRGVAFDRYNGRSWTNTFARRRLVVRNDEGIFTGQNEKYEERGPPGVRQQILIEALDTSVLFGMPLVDEIRGAFPAVQTDGMDGWSLPVPMAARFQYDAVSSVPKIEDAERVASSFEYPPDIREHFLDVPPLSPEVADLAMSVTRHAKSPFERIVSVQRHLMTNYRYSLDVDMDETRNPLEDFLFRRKSGYCEHYATAMVVMLRTLGIPARLVTGFLPGEWNEYGNYYRVRQRDAHAWVEVFFPQSGWITFDPTPTVGTGVPDPIWRKLGSLIDSVRLKWDRFVIQYSFRDQIAIVQAIRERSERVRANGAHLLETVRRWASTSTAWFAHQARPLVGLFVIVAVLGLSAFVALAIKMYKGRRAAALHAVREQVAVKMYARMLRLLSSRGLRKAGGCTPLEFSRRIAEEWADAGPFVTPLTELYCRVRYGHEPFEDHDRQRAEELLQGLRAAAPSVQRRKRLALTNLREKWKMFTKREV